MIPSGSRWSAVQSGYNAALSGYSRATCPYIIGSDEYFAWLGGYADAERNRPDHVAAVRAAVGLSTAEAELPGKAHVHSWTRLTDRRWCTDCGADGGPWAVYGDGETPDPEMVPHRTLGDGVAAHRGERVPARAGGR